MNAISKNYKRIIINNFSRKTDQEVVSLVLEVIRKGRVSGDGQCYCYGTRFDDVVINAALTARTKNDVFNIYAISLFSFCILSAFFLQF